MDWLQQRQEQYELLMAERGAKDLDPTSQAMFDLHNAVVEEIDCQERLRALLEAMECQNIDALMKEPVSTFTTLGRGMLAAAGLNRCGRGTNG